MKRASILSLALIALLATNAVATLTAKDIALDGMKLTIIPADKTFQINPLPVSDREATGKLKAVTPSWSAGFRLPHTSWRYGVLRPGSLTVTVTDGGQKLTEGVDYSVDYAWGTIGAVKGSKTKPGTELKFKYQTTESRLDLICKTADGEWKLIEGKLDSRQPALPEAPKDATRVLSVYLPQNTTELTMDNVNLIDPAATGVPKVKGAGNLAKTKAKLAAGEPVTIVFLGDSITAQKPKDFRDGRGSYVDRFTTYMETKYPDREVIKTTRRKVVKPAGSQIVIVKAGKGGDTTTGAGKRVKPDVLAHKPDAVVVMFGANDENRRGQSNAVPPTKYKENLSSIVDQIKAADAEVIIMTPSMKNLNWSATFGNMAEYAAVGRFVARTKKTCLIDNFKAWEDLPKVGYNYMVYLGTCINHPVDLGHELFFQGLKSAFEQ